MLWECRNRTLSIGEEPLIMGILNVTPDSFSDGGQFSETANAVAHGLRMEQEGARILDVGGESSRPGAAPVPADEECRRVLPVITQLRQQSDIPISIDTTKAVVAEAALQAGADIVNDISGLTADPNMIAVVRKAEAGVVVMHMQGTPQSMQDNPSYQNAPAEIADWLANRLVALQAAGIPATRLAIDPGIGFGKSCRHNLEILQNIRQFHIVNRPILVGASRKRFIGLVGQAPQAADRLAGSLAALTCAVYQGAHILRVHDVRPSLQAARVAAAVRVAHPERLDWMED